MAYRKSHISTIDVPKFDGRLDYSSYLSDPKFFLIGCTAWTGTLPGTRYLKWRKPGSLSRNWLNKQANTGPMWWKGEYFVVKN